MALESSIQVACPGRSVKLPLHRFAGADGRDAPRLLIVAGVHGREHSGIRTAFTLIERLSGLSDMHGVIEILPIAKAADRPGQGPGVDTMSNSITATC